jgi:hypothetical protein
VRPPAGHSHVRARCIDRSRVFFTAAHGIVSAVAGAPSHAVTPNPSTASQTRQNATKNGGGTVDQRLNGPSGARSRPTRDQGRSEGEPEARRSECFAGQYWVLSTETVPATLILAKCRANFISRGQWPSPGPTARTGTDRAVPQLPSPLASAGSQHRGHRASGEQGSLGKVMAPLGRWARRSANGVSSRAPG